MAMDSNWKSFFNRYCIFKQHRLLPAYPPKAMLNERELQIKSVEYRKTLLSIIKASGAGHTGGDLSCIDILNVLYNRIMRVSPETFRGPEHDHYIQSKGHCAEALFTVLADR